MTRCPYCDIEVSESAIEAEDGCCPECGSVITAPSQFMGEDDEFDDDELDGTYDDLDDDDDDHDFVDEDGFDEQLFDEEEGGYDEDYKEFEEAEDDY